MMNAISKLKEYHEKHRREESPPSYEDGPITPNGEFTIICRFLSIDVDGRGKRKKDAKCEAASNMLSLIKPNDLSITSHTKTPSPLLPVTDNKLTPAKTLPSNIFFKPKLSLTDSVSDIMKFKNGASDEMGEISNYDEACDIQDVNVGFSKYNIIIDDPSDNPIKKFISIITNHDLKYSYSILPSSKQCVTLLIKLSHYDVVNGYSAETEEEAIQGACQRILEMINEFSS